MGRKLIDLKGKTFSRLKVIGLFGRTEHGVAWLCKCACGVEKAILGHLLRRGQVKSCGCLRDEVGRNHLAEYRLSGRHSSLRHGEARQGKETTEWHLWHSIKQRCGKHPDYHGRGIKMCDEWQSSYETFLAEVGRRPSPGYSLDRINVNGNYEPGNVRWATKKEQARNRRNSLFLECNGERRTLAEWAEITGLKNTTIRNRIKLGWPVERAITTACK